MTKDGERVLGTCPPPISPLANHSRVYSARPDPQKGTLGLPTKNAMLIFGWALSKGSFPRTKYFLFFFFNYRTVLCGFWFSASVMRCRYSLLGQCIASCSPCCFANKRRTTCKWSFLGQPQIVSKRGFCFVSITSNLGTLAVSVLPSIVVLATVAPYQAR